MGLISEIKALFEKNETAITDVKFVDVKAADGKILRVQDMAVGSTIVEINEDGEVAVEDGSYVLEDGTTLVVEGGLITEIVVAEVIEEMANVMRTDGVAIYYDGTELIPGETRLFLDEAMTEPAPDGEHLLEGGIKVTIVDGVLTEMEEVEAEDIVEDVVEEETFMDITLKDGPIAHIVTAMEGEIKAGDKMMLDGTEAGPGEYFTNDQKIIVVGEFGVISEVKDAPAQTAEEKEVQGVVNNLKELINQVKQLKSQFEAEVSELKKENSELKERVEKFAGAPSAEPTKTTVTLKGQTKEEKLKFFGQR